VLRAEPHGDVTVLADGYQGRQLNNPNDLVYRSDGTVFFTDPRSRCPAASTTAKKELPFSGVFAIRGGVVQLVADGLRGPNGIALSPDERHLRMQRRRCPRRRARGELPEAGLGARQDLGRLHPEQFQAEIADAVEDPVERGGVDADPGERGSPLLDAGEAQRLERRGEALGEDPTDRDPVEPLGHAARVLRGEAGDIHRALISPG
jgi:hypothetical protein